VKPRLLATDDRPEILRLLERTLGDRYECEFASDVTSAREKLAGPPFQLALCDIQMPGESGLVLVEEIAGEHPETAIVLVTGVDDPDIAERALELGAQGYLVKPFWPGQLLITTTSAMHQRKLELAQQTHNRALEDRIQILMDTAPVPIYIKDRERRYIIANRVAHEAAGLEPNELIGLSDRDIMSPEAEHIAEASDRTVLEEGGTYTSEETMAVGGEERTFLTVKFPYVDDTGEIVGITGISTDITAKKQAEELREKLTATQLRSIKELRASRQETVERLIRAIELHDPETGLHVKRMAATASFLAAQVDLDHNRVLLLRTAAPMHDVGKIATPDGVLRKQGPLTTDERKRMEAHTTVGHEILAGSESELLKMAATIALTHHEWFDGSGYPQALSDGDIPIEGRIVAVADVLDALLSDRPYRPAMSVEQATKLIVEERGTHFDPTVVDALMENLDAAIALRG
jgi:putative two-component system response regulator